MINKNSKEYKEELENAIFKKITDMMNAYQYDTGKSPVKEVSIEDIIFEDDFYKELKKHIPNYNYAKIILIKKLIDANF